MGATNVHSEIEAALNEFGLSEVEVSVYKTVLSLGSRPASVISQKTGLKRGHTYNILQTLMQKGIVQEFVKNNVKHFTCLPPRALLGMIEQREDELAMQKRRLERIIPHLESLHSPVVAQPKVRFFHGIEGIKEVYEDMLRVPNQPIYGVLDVLHASTFTRGEPKDWLHRFIRRRAEQNIWWYGIVNVSDEMIKALEDRPWINREVRLAEGLTLPAEISIYGNKVALISAREESIAILIENKPIADTLRNIHQAVWPLLRRYQYEGELQSVA